MSDLKTIIEQAWEQRDGITPTQVSDEVKDAIIQSLSLLDSGAARVAEKISGEWVVHQWLKKAVLLSFRIRDNQPMNDGVNQFYDKVPLKFSDYTPEQFQQGGMRVVPNAVARQGSFVGKNVVLMPSYVNIGAYVDEGTMVDTWATVGSCAQVGRNVHLSGGVGIGGVLEPPNAIPVVIGDECLIGSRSVVAEGARVGDGAVLGAGSILTGSIPVIDASSGEELNRGSVPPWCVAIPATRSRSFQGGEFGLSCMLIVRYLEPGERHDKSTLNDILRTHGAAT